MSKMILTTTAAAVAVTMLAGSAEAISRYNSPSLSCARIHDIIASERAAIFRFPSTHVQKLTLYDRYVSDSAYCDTQEVIERVTIPSSNGACPVLHCVPRTDDCDDIFSVLCRN